MIDLNKLKKCIDLNNPNKALEYLENNMTKHELYMYIVNKIIDQKNNDCVCIPMPTVYNLFMSFIQDKCDEPFYVLSPFYSKKEGCIYDMFISKVDFIDDFKFADEQ